MQINTLSQSIYLLRAIEMRKRKADKMVLKGKGDNIAKIHNK